MITGSIFQLGTAKFTVDLNSLLKTLEAFEKVPNADYKIMADALEIPCAPFEKKLLKPVLMGAVQNAWYQATEEAVPEKCLFNQEKRLERYAALLEEVKNNDGKDFVVTRRGPTDTKAPRQSSLYRLTEKTREVWEKFKGQKYLIVQAMLTLNAGPDGDGCSVRQIADTVRDTPETKAPSDKNCAFHINAFGHEEITEKVGGAEETETPKAPKEPKAEKEPKAPKEPRVEKSAKKAKK